MFPSVHIPEFPFVLRSIFPPVFLHFWLYCQQPSPICPPTCFPIYRLTFNPTCSPTCVSIFPSASCLSTCSCFSACLPTCHSYLSFLFDNTLGLMQEILNNRPNWQIIDALFCILRSLFLDIPGLIRQILNQPKPKTC